MSQILVECHHCEGTGKIALTQLMLATLDLVPKKGARSTVDMLKDCIGVENAALCNRLVYLQSLGLVESQRRGKNKYWRRK